MSFLREEPNEYGVLESYFKCEYCGTTYRTCQRGMTDAQREAEDHGGCQSAECDSYDPKRDANVLFGDYSRFQRYCERMGASPEKLSHLLLGGSVYAEKAADE